MNRNKQWIRDPEHPTQWILNPNFRPSESEPPSMQIQPIEEPIITLPVESPSVEIELPSMHIQPIEEPVIQLPVEVPHVELPQVAPPKQIQPIPEPVKQVPVEVPHVELPQVVLPPPVQIQPIVDPVQSPGVVIDSGAPPLFHPGFFCIGAAHCPHFSHKT